MGALGALGIGLSVLFGVFLAVLAAEIWYMLCCRQRNSNNNNLRLRSASRRVSSVHVIEAEAAAAAAGVGDAYRIGNGTSFAQEAALVGSFGGYPSQAEFVSKFFAASQDDDGYLPPLDGVLFTITEETKEEMELYNTKPSPAPAVVEVAATLPQQLPVADATPFATPPTSPESSTLSSPCLSPVTAVSRFSVMSSPPTSAVSSPALSRFSAYSPAYWPPGVYSPSPSPDTPAQPEHAPLGVLFRRPYSSPHQQQAQLPPRSRNWPGHVIDFRHALPFSPPNVGAPQM